jgi:hypothetical protein
MNKKEACGGGDLDLSPQIMFCSVCISLSIATHGKYMRVCLCHGPQSSFPACPLACIMIGSILKTDYFMQNCFKYVVIFLMRSVSDEHYSI